MGFGFLVLLLTGSAALAVALGGSKWPRQTAGFRPSGEQPRSTPRDLLDERLARGEIGQQEYEAIRARLES
jgi:uncharacterized membrane protein